VEESYFKGQQTVPQGCVSIEKRQPVAEQFIELGQRSLGFRGQFEQCHAVGSLLKATHILAQPRVRLPQNRFTKRV